MQRSYKRTIFDNLLGGSTFNFADEITSALAAPYVAYSTGMTIPEAYKAGQELSQNEINYDEVNRPYTKLSSEVVGGLINPATYIGVGAAQKATTATQRMMKALQLGGIQGAAYGAGSGNGVYDRLQNAAIGGVVGGATSGVLQGAGEIAKNPQVQKFAKDYIADESGALTIGGKPFDKSTLDENITRFLDEKIKAPQKVYRGVSEESGNNMAVFGQGLYSTPTKSMAGKYGKVSELNSDAIPNNPIKFKDAFQFQNFIGAIADKMGVKKNNMGVEYQDIIKELGYDGVLIGQGKDSIVVKY